MLNTSAHSASIPCAHERRRVARQRVRSLVYLDAGPDNGGIALNLSEAGLALQAASPFTDKTCVILRIQPPNFRERIEASAEIAWLSDSKSLAGLRFLELSDGTRAGIAEWIAFEASEANPAGSSVPTAARAIPPKTVTQESARRREKWSIVLGEPAPAETAANQRANSPSVLANSVRRDDLEPQTVAILPEDSPDAASTIRHRMWLDRVAANEPDSPPNSHRPSDNIPDVTKFPPRESPTPAVRASFEKITPPVEADAAAPRDEALNVSVRPSVTRMNLPLSDVPRPNQFRSWLAIAVLFGCTALVFLFLGMFRQRLRNQGPGKSSFHGKFPTSAVGSSPRALGGAVPKPKKSGHETRHKDAGEVALFFPMKKAPQRISGGALADPRGADNGLTTAKVSLPSDPLRPATTSGSQNASASPLPFPPSRASEPPNLTVDLFKDNWSSGAAVDRRIDCYLLYRVEPLYPRKAIQLHIEGTVTMRAIIAEDGSVRSLQKVSGPDLLVPAALEAAREWHFMPALLNGQPIEEEKEIDIAFRLPH